MCSNGGPNLIQQQVGHGTHVTAGSRQLAISQAVNAGKVSSKASGIHHGHLQRNVVMYRPQGLSFKYS